MANFRYSHLFTTKIGNAAIEAAAAKLNAAEIALAISDGEEKILFKNTEGEVVAVATEEQIVELINNLQTVLSGAIEDEAARAEAAEAILDSRIESIESGSTQALDNEIARAEAAEAALSGAISDEQARALGAESDLLDIISGEVEDRKALAVASADYDSENKTIDFYNANNVKIDSIDATDFIKDGMIDSVTIETTGGTTYLVIVWNTDAGKETTRIDIGDIFDADNYYTKAETDEAIEDAVEAEELRATSAETALQNAIEAEATARDNADVKSMAVDANAGITLTLGNGSTIVATEASEITLSAGEF